MIDPSFQVDFFIVGAPKCGTTALAEYLSNHPDIDFSHPKEPHYFADDFANHRLVKSWDEYRRVFPKNDNISLRRGEGSVWYLYSEVALKKIHQVYPQARIIIMLRNPVDVISSLHKQQTLSLYEDQADLRVALELEDFRKQGQRIPKLCRQPELLLYREIVKFSQQLQRAMCIFPKDQIKVVIFEEFVSNTRSVYRQILKFIGVTDDGRTDFPIINSNRQFRNPLARRLGNMTPVSTRQLLTNMRLSAATRWIPELASVLLTSASNKREFPPDLRKELSNEFSQEIENISKVLDREMISWK